MNEDLEKAAKEHHVQFWFSEPCPESSFIAGAKWAKEATFTEEDIFKYSMHVLNCHMSDKIHLSPKEWKKRQ